MYWYPFDKWRYRYLKSEVSLIVVHVLKISETSLHAAVLLVWLISLSNDS